MVIPDTIAEVATGFKDVGKSIFQGIAAFIGNPMKAISKAFKGIANLFRTARLLIALKVLAVIAALQFVAERIDMIGDVFRKIWGKITDFFKGIIDWFKNSKLGKLLGFGKDDETTEQPADGSPIQMAKENTMEKLNEDKPGIIAKGFGKVKNLFGFGKKEEEQEPEKQLNENEKKIVPVNLKKANDGVEFASTTIDDVPTSSVADLKTLTGSVTADGESTPKQLSTLLDAQKAAESGNIINVQNNNQIANNTSGGSNATIGFSTHLPDESFINVRKDNTTQSI